LAYSGQRSLTDFEDDMTDQCGPCEETEYVTCRQRLARGVVEYRWNTPGGEILGHRNERLIADLREALHYQAACPEVAPSRFRASSARFGRLGVERLVG
jgi:hypothetical protein